MIWDSIVSSYYSFAVIAFFASIIGAIIVSAVDASRVEAGRLVPQH